MTKLNCSVIHCASNAEGNCCRPEITVNGTTACKCDETCCGSFTKIAEGATNSMDYSNPNPISDVNCTAKNCVHYKENKCCAESINVSGTTASNKTDTECDTFSCK